ncbi:MAG: twin-arginine translocase TatA/TatE family subunit [Candidatus Dormibacteraeota bacterium]|jgi:sec-independent protein translocase protein TatA|nr:twin-arginine translocase TatA/TatE family subunit [Candidatus Dormibacteraeota bacterium]
MISDHWPEILIVLLIALVVFGPKRLPELGQALGKAINEFRHATRSMTEEAKSYTTGLTPPPLDPSQSATVTQSTATPDLPGVATSSSSESAG